MSLSTFINKKEVKEKFKQFLIVPKLEKSEIIAFPFTNNYSLIGTAFDYFLRFYIKSHNPQSIIKKWVAELAIERLELIKNKENQNNLNDFIDYLKIILNSSKKEYNYFIKNKIIRKELFMSCLLLAQIDPIYRAGIIDKNIGNVDPRDIEDLKNLSSLIKLENFKSETQCLLNPTFGKASNIIGGADADLIIDNCIIEIKITKYLKLDRNFINQLIGYYYLSLIGGIDNSKSNKIEKVAVYFSRHGKLFTYNISEIIKDKEKKLFNWFKDEIQIKDY